jgi:hypothetical protein
VIGAEQGVDELCRHDDYADGQQSAYSWRSSRPKESQGQFSRGSERGASSVAVSERLPIRRRSRCLTLRERCFCFPRERGRALFLLRGEILDRVNGC